MGFRNVAGVEEILSATLMECDLGVDAAFGVWDQTFSDGTYDDGPVVAISKERLAVGSLGDDLVAVRIDPWWRRLYFAFGSERREAYRPSFVPEDTSMVDDDLTDPNWEDTPVADGGDAEDDESWAGEFPPAPEDGGEVPPVEEGEPEMPWGMTLPLKHYVQSSEMGREIAFVWADQGAVHVMTSKSGRYTALVTVFKKEWLPGPGFAGRWTPNHDPENYVPVTPARYKVRFPLPVQLLDFAWNAYSQKVMWTRREPRTYYRKVLDKYGQEEDEQWVEMTVGEFTPPDDDAMAHYRMLDGYEWDDWGGGVSPRADSWSKTYHKPMLQVLLDMSEVQSVQWDVHTAGGRFWVYTESDKTGTGWKHIEQGFWMLFENVGS